MAVLTEPLPHVPSCLQRAERLRAGWEQSSPARKMHFPVGTQATRCGWVLWGLGTGGPCLACGAARLASAPAQRASPTAAFAPHVPAHLLGRHRHKTDMHTHCPRGESAAHKHVA